MTKKMGFGSVLAIVFGSQIGAGILALPAQLAPFGLYGVYGWLVAGIEAMMLAFIFSELCSRYPVTGGTYIYVQRAFGDIAAFFTGWTYWIASVVSNVVLVIAAIGCLSVFFGENVDQTTLLILEVCLLSVLMIINCCSIRLAGTIETVLTLLKFIPFAIVPLVVFQNFESNNIALHEQFVATSPLQLLLSVVSISFFCFIGVECATAPAGAVENPSKTIPRAIMLGTFAVAIIYFVNNLAIMGVIPSSILCNSKAQFVDAVYIVLGHNVSRLLAIITSVVIIGTLNAWLITSSQISYSLAQGGFLPKLFAKTNRSNTPYVSVIVNCMALIPLLVMIKNGTFAEQIMYLIDMSVQTFLLVYIACTFAFLKLIDEGWKKIIGCISLIVCSIVLIWARPESITSALLFVATGIFVLPFSQKKI